MFHVRAITPSDVHFLIDLDNKSAEFALDAHDWNLIQSHFPDWVVQVGAFGYNPIAFSLTEYDKDERLARIHRLVVHRDHQRCGYGEALLNNIFVRAYNDKCDKVQILTPVELCKGPNHPLDISGWLTRHDFEVVGEVDGMFELYGEDISAYVFERDVN